MTSPTAFLGGRQWLAALTIGLGCAQAETAAQAPEPGDETPELPAITVTVNKQRQPLHEVAASVSALSGEDVRDNGAHDVQALSHLVPGLGFQPSGQSGLAPPVMRGMTANIISFSSATALLVDGVPTLRAQGFGDSLVGADRVEVLRGPQSTLYGRNAQAGVIHIVTRQPGNDPYALVSVGAGSRRQAVLRADLSRALAPDRLYLGVAAQAARQDGFIRNTYTGRRDDGRQHGSARLTLRWTPSARTDAALRLSMRRHDDGASHWGAPHAPRATVRSGHAGSNTAHGHTLALDVAHDFGAGLHARAITARNVWHDALTQDTDYQPADRLHLARNHRFATWSQEVRLQGHLRAAPDGRRVQWLAGLYADREDNRLGFVQKTPLATLPTQAAQKGHTAALFTHWSVPLASRWTLTAGARIERSRMRFALNQDMASSQAATRLTPKLALQYAWGPHATAWASVADGHRAGGFNAFAPATHRRYGAERARAFEWGIRGQLTQPRLRYSASLYHTRLRDMQVQQMGAPGQVYISNAAQASSRGGELELEYAARGAWLVQAGLSLNRTRFGRFIDGAARHDGKRNPFAPDATAYIGLRHDPGPWYVQARLHGSSRMYLDAANQYHRPGHSLLDLAAGWRLGRLARPAGFTGSAALSVYVRNAGNRRYDAVGFQNGSTVIYSPPREFGVNLSWKL
ncbi:TonB-dependent receptor [Comamonadaceae bacterium OH2545_COT-014]|nr:TonB-dependent receptor [Comamonadaceae bacterium OH2545_COT-014]